MQFFNRPKSECRAAISGTRCFGRLQLQLTILARETLYGQPGPRALNALLPIEYLNGSPLPTQSNRPSFLSNRRLPSPANGPCGPRLQ